MSSIVKQDVLGFQIPNINQYRFHLITLAGVDVPVDDVETVEMFQSHQQFRGVKSRPSLVESTLALQVMEKFSTIDKRQDQVQLFCRLERKLEGDDEWTIDLGEDGTFCQSVGDFGS